MMHVLLAAPAGLLTFEHLFYMLGGVVIGFAVGVPAGRGGVAGLPRTARLLAKGSVMVRLRLSAGPGAL